MVWWAYQQGLIALGDVRIWFACHELVARRCTVRRGEPRRYELAELDGLVGGRAGKHRVAGLRRLERAGLLAWSSTSIQFGASPDCLPVADLADFWAMLGEIKNAKRRLPVPRRTIREIAGGLAPVVIASMLGHLLRCVYLFRGEFRSEGCCKASWVAKVFQVDERGVKRARKQLAGIGWLKGKSSEHWHRQRWGGRVVVNLAWSRGGEQPADREVANVPAVRVETELPPRGPDLARRLPRPESEKELPLGYQNQKPAGRGPSGVLKTKETGEKKPTMRHVELRDLKDTRRLLDLFDDAVDRGVLTRGSEHERLLFVGAAERALYKGSINPCGFFVRMVKCKLWHHVTQGDEDSAHVRIKRHFQGDVWKREPEPEFQAPRLPRVELSIDARIVAAVRNAVERHRLRGDPFHVLKRERPEWTRERWDAAVGELDSARLQVLQSRKAMVYETCEV